MKKSILTVFLSLILLVSITGCSRQVELKTGVANSTTIKSCAYDVTLSAEVTGDMNSISEPGDLSSMLSAGKVSLNFNGKMLTDEERTKISSNVKASSAGVSFEAPMYIDSSNSKLDFDMIIGLPEILKSMMGDQLANTSYLRLASKDLESYMKSASSAEDYQKFEDSITKAMDPKDNKNAQVSKDILDTINSYLDKNEKKVQTFEKLDDKSTSKNGVYTIKFSKDDIKAIISNYLSNEKYFSNLKEVIKEAEEASEVKSENMEDAKTLIEESNKAIDAAEVLDIVSTFTIEDKLITKTNVKFDVTVEGSNVKVEIDSKLSEINKITSITPPETTEENTLNIMEFIQQLTQY
jgi:ribosomal protein S20